MDTSLLRSKSLGHWRGGGNSRALAKVTASGERVEAKFFFFWMDRKISHSQGQTKIYYFLGRSRSKSSLPLEGRQKVTPT